MSGPRKFFAVVFAAMLVLGSVQIASDNGWMPEWLNNVTPGPTTKCDLVIAVYESDNQPPAEASLMAGITPQAMRKAGKWRQYDKDVLPEKWKAELSPVVAKLGSPCIAAVHGGKVTASAKFPKSDADISAWVQSQGGY